MTTTLNDDPVLDEEWLSAPRKRPRLRLVLAVLLAASVCFLGGALVQKHLGSDSATTAAVPGGGAFAAGGTAPDLSGAGGQLPTGGDTAAAGGAGDAADDTEAVVGTVESIDGDVWTVKDLGGKKHKIRVTDDSDVVRETELAAGDVAVGDRVDISGTATDGQLTAEDITLR